MQIYYFARKVDAAEWQAMPTTGGTDVVIYEDEAFVPANVRATNRYAAATIHTESRQIYTQCLNEVAAFAYAPTQNGQTLIEQLTLNGTTHWFYLRMSLFYRYHSILSNARKITLSLQQIGILPHQINTLHVFHTQVHISPLLPQSMPLRLYLPPPQNAQPNKTKTPYWFMAQYLLMFLLRALLGIWQLRLLVGTKPQHVLVTDPELLQNMVDIHNPEATLQTDTYLGYLMEEVKNRPDFLFLSEIQPPRLDNARKRRISRKLLLPAYPGRTLHFDVFTFFTLLNPITWLQLYRAYRSLRRIRPHPTQNVGNRCLFELLPDTYPLILQGVFRYRAARLFASMARVAGIAAPNEHAVNNKPLLDAVAANGGISIGIQHGTLSVFYQCFHPNDVQYKHLPHHTIFWGNYYLQALSKENGNYTPQNSICLGQLRTDAIPALSQKLTKKALHPRLADDKPLLLYLSQPLIGNEQPLRQQIAADFLELGKHFPHCQLLIKPHPLETDHRFFYDIAQQVGNTNFLLLTEELYRLLAVADVVITYHSTAGAEAVYFKKILLVADYLHNDAAGYIQQGVGLGYHNAKELLELVRRVLTGKCTINNQQQNLFITNRTCAIDGQTAKRYLEFIIQATLKKVKQ